MRELGRYHESVLSMMGMKDDRQRVQKLEKQSAPGDDGPCEHPELCRSAVCTLLSMTSNRKS